MVIRSAFDRSQHRQFNGDRCGLFDLIGAGMELRSLAPTDPPGHRLGCERRVSLEALPA